MNPILAADSIGKSFRGRRVLSAASLAVMPGVVTYLAGRNGAGKSTLLQICAGRLAPDHGTIRIAGGVHSRVRLHRLARAGVFFLPARSLLTPSLTVGRQLRIVAERYGNGEVEETAKRVGILPLLDALPPALSGGERRRAGVSLALLRDPRCLLADEPLRGVEPREAEVIARLLRQLAAQGCGVVVTGHDLPTLLSIADDVLWLADGTTYPLGAPRDAQRHPRLRRHLMGEDEMVEQQESAATPTSRPPERATSPVPGVAPARTPKDARQHPTSHVDKPPLLIDRQTLRDLEIFDPLAGGGGLFARLDRTLTSGGKARLRRHFLQPPSDAAAIVATQDAVRFLVQHPTALAAFPDAEQLKGVERYRHSSYETSRFSKRIALAADGLWSRVRDVAEQRDIEGGVIATVGFLRSMTLLAADLRDAGSPPMIGRVADQIREIAGGSSMARLALEEGTQRIRLWEVRALDRLLRDQLQSDIDQLMECVHQLDALRSMALATRAQGWVFPTLLAAERPVVRIRAVRHPLLDPAIPNDLDLGDPKRTVFLTGPNMAGKTTYLKACALAVYLAHLGMGVPAAAMELTPMEALFASINTSDNLRVGYSYFHAEVQRVKEAAQLLRGGKRALIVFDEVFKGTNVHDARDASTLVIRGFSRFPNGASIISSHLVELANELEVTGAVQFHCFDAELRDNRPVYDHRLKDGVSSQRLGMHVLRREGVADLLGEAAPDSAGPNGSPESEGPRSPPRRSTAGPA